MEEYISKASLVAKIEKTRNQEVQWMNRQGYTEYHQGLRDGYANILSLINTLEVKGVDLEGDVDKILEANDWNFDKIDFYQFAKHFFELGIQVNNKALKGE